MSPAPQGGQPSDSAPTHVAATNPTQTVPAPAANGGGYLVQVSWQKNEADAQES